MSLSDEMNDAWKVVGPHCRVCGKVADPLTSSLSTGAMCIGCFMDVAMKRAKEADGEWLPKKP